MSDSFVNSKPLHLGHLISFEVNALKSFSNQMSAPSFSAASARASITDGLRSEASHLLHLSAGIGTPHARCLERHQSGRASIIA